MDAVLIVCLGVAFLLAYLYRDLHRSERTWYATDSTQDDAMAQMLPIDNVHCDLSMCNKLATKRVRPHGIAIRGSYLCEEHAQALLADGRRKGKEWDADSLCPVGATK